MPDRKQLRGNERDRSSTVPAEPNCPALEGGYRQTDVRVGEKTTGDHDSLAGRQIEPIDRGPLRWSHLDGHALGLVNVNRSRVAYDFERRVQGLSRSKVTPEDPTLAGTRKILFEASRTALDLLAGHNLALRPFDERREPKTKRLLLNLRHQRLSRPCCSCDNTEQGSPGRPHRQRRPTPVRVPP
jgi:hypothetical protein